MSKLTRVALVILAVAVIVGGCVGCGPIPSFTQFDGLNRNTKDAVVVRLDGEVTPAWLGEIDRVAQDQNTKLLILWIDSPGGYVSDTKLLAHGIQIIKVKYNKPVWVYSEVLLASGAYWAACEADSIYASPVSMVGSIGVYSVRVDATAQDSMMGLKYYFFASGPNKIAGSPHVPMTPDEWLSRSNAIRPLYVQFVTQVLMHRFPQLQARTLMASGQLDTGSVVRYTLQLADGSVYGGATSRDLGLVDGVYYFDEFCGYLRNLGYVVKRANGTTINTFYDE